MPIELLCHFDGTSGSTSFTDASSYAHALTASGVTVNTTAPKFGTGVGDFTSSSAANISAGTSTDFNLGSGKFTMEAWCYFKSLPTHCSIFGRWDASGTTNLGWEFAYDNGQLRFYWTTNGTTVLTQGATYTQALNTWTHLAVDYDGGNLRGFANGSLVILSVASIGTVYPSTAPMMIGNDARLAYAFPGYIDEARITIGADQYPVNSFTPPTAPFSDPVIVDFAGNIGSTSLYGKGLYGAALYSSGGPLAPIIAGDITLVGQQFFTGDLAPAITFNGSVGFDFSFTADLSPQVAFSADLTLVTVLSGDLAPQVTFSANLSLDVAFQASLTGRIDPVVGFAASSMISGPLWGDAEPCPPPLWTEAEPCPPSLWTPVDCGQATWQKVDLCHG